MNLLTCCTSFLQRLRLKRSHTSTRRDIQEVKNEIERLRRTADEYETHTLPLLRCRLSSTEIKLGISVTCSDTLLGQRQAPKASQTPWLRLAK